MCRILFKIILLSLLISAAQASLLKQDVPDIGVSSLLLFENDPTLVRNSQLQELMALMEAGKRDEANLRIARLLAKNNQDKGALELAGISLMQMKNFKVAEEAFRRLMQLPPVKPSVITRYGVTKIINGDVEFGVKLLRQVVQYTPNDALANRYLGWVAEKTGDFVGAVTYLSKLPSVSQVGVQEYHVDLARNNYAIGAFGAIVEMFEPLYPRYKVEKSALSTGAAFYLTLAYAAQGDKGESASLAKALRPYMSANPLNLFGLDMGLASIYKDEEAGVAALDLLISKEPGGEASGRYELAKLYVNSDNIPAAVAELDSVLILAHEADIANVLNMMVPLLVGESMNSHAVNTMRKLVRKYPSNNSFLFGLAEVYAISGMDDEFVNAIDKLVSEPKTYSPAYRLGAKWAAQKGDLVLEKRYLEQYTRAEPQELGGWVALAGFNYNRNKLDDAIQVIKLGIQSNPKSAQLKYELGSLYQARGDIELANQQYRDSLKLKGDYFQAMDNLASNLLDANTNLDEAAQYAGILYKVLPEDPYIQDLMGWSLYRSGAFKDALVYFKESAAVIVDSGRSDYHAGLTLIELGRKKEATVYLKSALSKGLSKPLINQVNQHLSGLH
ncbi:MAG: tetratricopeptide repeat protein [Pseudomonadales bacterium]